MPEAVLFDVVKVTDGTVDLAREIGIALVAGITVAAVLGRFRPAAGRAVPSPPVATVPALLARLAGAVTVFIAGYFVAGMIIFPFVRDYYASRAMPGLGAILAMQVLRSLALVAAAYPLLRTIPSRRGARITLAIVLPVIGGIAPLLPPSELMPAAVRLVHALEITPYYALFGFLLAVWFGTAKAVRPATAATTVAPDTPPA